MPLLSAAAKVVVLTVEGGTVPGPSGEQVARHLVRNDIDANAITVGQDGRLVGEAMKRSGGQADAQAVREMLASRLRS